MHETGPNNVNLVLHPPFHPHPPATSTTTRSPRYRRDSLPAQANSSSCTRKRAFSTVFFVTFFSPLTSPSDLGDTYITALPVDIFTSTKLSFLYVVADVYLSLSPALTLYRPLTPATLATRRSLARCPCLAGVTGISPVTVATSSAIRARRARMPRSLAPPAGRRRGYAAPALSRPSRPWPAAAAAAPLVTAHPAPTKRRRPPARPIAAANRVSPDRAILRRWVGK